MKPILRLASIASIAVLALAADSSAAHRMPTREGDDVAKPGGDDAEFKRQVELKKKQLDRTFGAGFFIYFCDDGIMPRPYLVAAEAKKSFDPETLEKEYAEILGHLYQEFFKQYGSLLDLTHIEEPIVALVWDSRASYEKLFKEEKTEFEKAAVEKREPKLPNREIHGLADPEFMAGYFRPDTEYLYQWRQEDLWHVMFHEGTHQLVHHATKKFHGSQWAETPWFQEGIADFMGGHTSKLGYSEEKKGFVREFKLGQFIEDRYSTLSSGIAAGEYYSLKDLCYLDFMSFKMAQNNQSGAGANQRKTGLVYAQGWALVKFLNQYQDGKYRGNFNEYFKRECRGQAGGDAFAEIFTLESDQDWADFEAEWIDWVLGDLRAEKPRKK